MKTVVDVLDSGSGFSGTGSVVVHAVNALEEYIAGYQDGSVVFSFPSGSLGDSISKTVSVDVTGLDTLVVSLWSRNLGQDSYRTRGDCQYTLTLANGFTRYIRTFSSFTHETIDITDLDTITEITFEAMHDQEDYLIASYMVASLPELPLDIMEGMRETLELLIAEQYPSGYEVGDATVVAGDTAVIVADDDLLFRYAVITLDDGGGNVETHQVDDVDALGIRFNSNFDGKAVVNTMSCTAYLQFPVELYRLEEEVAFPGITLYGMDPEPVPRQNDSDVYTNSFSDTTTVEETEGQIFSWPIQVDVHSRTVGMVGLVSSFVRRLMATHLIWVNGMRFEFDAEDPATEQLPSDVVDAMSNVTYTVPIEAKEQIWRRTRAIALPATQTVTPVPQGNQLLS